MRSDKLWLDAWWFASHGARWKLERSRAKAAGELELWCHYGMLTVWRRFRHNEATRNNELLKMILKANRRYSTRDTRPRPRVALQEEPRLQQAQPVSADVSVAVDHLSQQLLQLDERHSRQLLRLEEKQDRVLNELSKLMSHIPQPVPPPPPGGQAPHGRGTVPASALPPEGRSQQGQLSSRLLEPFGSRRSKGW